MRNEGINDNRKVKVLWNPSMKPTQKHNGIKKVGQIRVAAYNRVSTDLEEQNESFELQERYYAKLISNTPGWRFAGVYSDKGMTGTARSQRIGFQRMIRHCEEGKIDRIICKSISRFARNTADLLDVVRLLKNINVSVFFEKEGIDTLSEQSEFLLSTIAAIAQEESRSISENMAWSFKKRFQQGIPVFKRIMGYDVNGKGDEKTISINEDEAAIVREIYQLALDGSGYKAIASIMMQKGYKTFEGKTEWSTDRVKGILKNERYTGDVLCQKTYTADYLTHGTVRNTGKEQQYLIENNHPAIISHEMFEQVQKLFRNNKRGEGKKNVIYPFSSRIICGECGARYHRYITWPNARWGCSRSIKSHKLCNTENVPDSDIEKALLKGFSERYDMSDKSLISKIKHDLRSVQDKDNVERKRVIMKRELSEALHKELHTNGDMNRMARAERMIIEENLKEKEEFWLLIEKDRSWRTKTLDWLEDLPKGENEVKTFFNELDGSYLRAWVIGITVLSPKSFRIRWLDDTETKVSIE
jgi:DNA invertase Pin-like site-specific DNA recombinase